MSQGVKVNSRVLDMEYAVRGPIPQRAAEMAAQGRRIIPCNIGNPQALGQQPIGFYRQVLSLLEDPAAIARERKLRDAGIAEAFPEDIIDIASTMLDGSRTGSGAYTESAGFKISSSTRISNCERVMHRVSANDFAGNKVTKSESNDDAASASNRAHASGGSVEMSFSASSSLRNLR